MRTKCGLNSGFSGNVAAASERGGAGEAQVVAADVATAVLGLEEGSLTQVAFDHLGVAPAERDHLVSGWATAGVAKIETVPDECEHDPQQEMWVLLVLSVMFRAAAEAASGHLAQLLLAAGKEGAA